MADRIARYVALYWRPDDLGGSYFRTLLLRYEEGMIPPPVIKLAMGAPAKEHEFFYANTQTEIATIYGLSQQTVSRWLRRQAPDLS